jgi:hypothetical protein
VPFDRIDDFAERFPKVIVTSHLFDWDRDRLTACGGMAVLDLLLAVLAKRLLEEREETTSSSVFISTSHLFRLRRCTTSSSCKCIPKKLFTSRRETPTVYLFSFLG